MNTIVQSYQSRVLGPEESVDYASIIKQSYPPQAIQSEPFVGFKVLCTDTMAYSTNPAERMRYVDMNINVIRGRGCLVRETSSHKPDGFWVISLPVPRSQVVQQLNNLFDVLATFEQHLGIVKDGLFEINVSGRCNVMEVETCFQRLMIPQRHMSKLVPSNNMLCTIGKIQRINNDFICLRTRWDLTGTRNNQQLTFEDLTEISQLISLMYH
jgi:hypothetical protein